MKSKILFAALALFIGANLSAQTVDKTRLKTQLTDIDAILDQDRIQLQDQLCVPVQDQLQDQAKDQDQLQDPDLLQTQDQDMLRDQDCLLLIDGDVILLQDLLWLKQMDQDRLKLQDFSCLIP